MSVQEAKKRLRTELRSRVKLRTEQQQALLRSQLLSWLRTQAGVWAAFWPLPGEPDLRPLSGELPSLDWVYPRIEEEELHFHGPVVKWVQGPYGITEPSPDTPSVDMSRIAGILIPGLGFDRKGRRLGRGKGFYDRRLQGWNGTRVGVCFDDQWVPEIPVERFDQSVDLVMTESGLYRPDRKVE